MMRTVSLLYVKISTLTSFHSKMEDTHQTLTLKTKMTAPCMNTKESVLKNLFISISVFSLISFTHNNAQL